MLLRRALLCASLTFFFSLAWTFAARGQMQGADHLKYASETWDATFFNPQGRFDTSVPTPEDFLGFPVGKRPIRYSEMRLYFQALAESSSRARLFTHGETHEGRPLLHLAISTPERIANLEAVQSAMQRFGDPRLPGPDVVPEDLPLISWFGYSIHGDELSGCDAAVEVAYQLAAGTDKLTRHILENVLTFVDPLQNPDGRERYLSQIQSLTGRVANADDQSLQHRGYWPWGRANHYLFDLNRDWFNLVHPESRGRVAAISHWNPQLVIDGHEMGWDETYLFSPPREPFNPHIATHALEWWEQFASDQASAFDAHGWSFFTREWNEEFFPGYGSSWAAYVGAIGILYEQARTSGSVVRQTDGSYLTFREAVQHQFTSTWSNLKTAADHRVAILRDFRADRATVIREGRSGALRAYVFVPRRNPTRMRRFIHTLLQQGIEVQRASSDLNLSGAHDYWGENWKHLQVPQGSYVVDMAQPAYRLLRNILDFHVAMPDSFLREERDYLENGKGSRLYEVTSWSMPIGYGIETYWTSKRPKGKLQKVDRLELLQVGTVHPDMEPSYGYLLDANDDAFPAALARLLADAWDINIALDDFQLAGQSFSRGSVLLRVNANPETLHATMRQIAGQFGIDIHATNSGRPEVGPDMGGSKFPALLPPRIGILAGAPLSFTSYGALWHLLDHDLRLRVSSLAAQNVEDMQLEKYNVLIMPDAGGTLAYRRALGENGEKKIKKWVEDGGTLITIGGASEFVADSTVAWSSVRLRHQDLAVHAPTWAYLPLPESRRMRAVGDLPGDPTQVLMPIYGKGTLTLLRATHPRGVQAPLRADWKNVTHLPGEGEAEAKDSDNETEKLAKADERLQLFYPQGAFLALDVDAEHWLTAGIPARVPGLITHKRAFVASDPVTVLARFAIAEDLQISGLLWPEAANRLARTAFVTQESLGKGQIILFSGDPTFRRSTPGTERFLLNALLLGPALGTTHAAPW